MDLQAVRFLNGGYCVQNEYFVGTGRFGWRRFEAVFVHFRHPVHGECLIDSGYGPRLIPATRRFPGRLLRWATFVPRRQPFLDPGYLERQRLLPEKIENVFISHFHADHIGGLEFFPQSRFVHRTETLASLLGFSRMRQVHEGFLIDLLPIDLRERGIALAESRFDVDPARFPRFRTCDYWGDGSLILIDLPGHALGHTGYLLQTTDGPLLYVVDAFWDRLTFLRERQLPWLARRVQHDYQAYSQTLTDLRAVLRERPMEPLGCHCPATQALVTRSSPFAPRK